MNTYHGAVMNRLSETSPAARAVRNIALGELSDALVMMIDDEPLVIELTEAFLQGAGFRRFSSTSDASDGIPTLLRERPDVVLLDINMPRVSGFEVLTQMQADPVLKHIPVIVLTSADDPDTKLKALELGATDFLRKPVDPSELALRVRNTLAAKAHREALRKTFVRYISPRLAEGILDGSAPFASPAQRADVVALFADLRGFTSITEAIDVQEVVGMLNEFFSALTDATYRHEGTIFNMAGDSLLLGFNVPFSQPDAAAGWQARYGISTGVGIGICRGHAVIGNVGSPHYMSYTMIGNAVNAAARLMQIAQAGEALVSGDFYNAVRHLVPADKVESLGLVTLRGRSEAMPVYSIRA